MNELAVKAGTDTLQKTDRDYIQAEVDALITEIDRVAATTTFNEQALLDGSFTGKKLQVGAESDASNQIAMSIASMTFKGVAGVSSLSITGSDGSNARTAISTIKGALEKVSKQRSDLGAIQNRLEHTVKNLDNVVENTQAAESQIRDTDMATEMVRYSNNNVLAQAGQSMLAQANQSNQGVLSLLG